MHTASVHPVASVASAESPHRTEPHVRRDRRTPVRGTAREGEPATATEATEATEATDMAKGDGTASTVTGETAPVGTAGPASATETDGAPEAAGGEGDIAARRREVDELDTRIIALVEERMAVSDGIQRARIAAGGRRVELAREKEIIDRYSGSLGRPGAQLAMVLLGLCRGGL